MCSANQWTGFYMITASAMKQLKLTNITLSHKSPVIVINPFNFSGLFLFPLGMMALMGAVYAACQKYTLLYLLSLCWLSYERTDKSIKVF